MRQCASDFVTFIGSCDWWSVLLWRWFFTKIPNIRHPIRYWHTYLRSLRTHPTNKTKKIIPFLSFDTQFLYFIYFFHLHFATQLFFHISFTSAVIVISVLFFASLGCYFCYLRSVNDTKDLFKKYKVRREEKKTDLHNSVLVKKCVFFAQITYYYIKVTFCTDTLRL